MLMLLPEMCALLVLLSLISLRPSFPSRKRHTYAPNNWYIVKTNMVIGLYIPVHSSITICFYICLGVHIAVHQSYLNVYLFICLDNWSVSYGSAESLHPSCNLFSKNLSSLEPTCSKESSHPLLKAVMEVGGKGPPELNSRAAPPVRLASHPAKHRSGTGVTSAWPGMLRTRRGSQAGGSGRGSESMCEDRGGWDHLRTSLALLFLL